MFNGVFAPDVTIYLAGGAYILGYLIINQVLLRLVFAVGTFFYILYYASVAAEPLWGAIYTSVAMGIANLIGLTALFAGRSRLVLPRAYRDIYPNFEHLSPGDFRALFRRGTRYQLAEDTLLTQEGVRPNELTYIVTGNADVCKRGETFKLPPGLFVGEVAYMLQRPSAATTMVPKGAEVITWDTNALDKACRRLRFKLTLEAAISRDMAAKVAFAVAPGDLRGGQATAFDTAAPAQ